MEFFRDVCVMSFVLYSEAFSRDVLSCEQWIRSSSTSCGAASWFIRTTNVLMLVIFVPSVPLQQLIYYYSVCLRAPTVGGFAPHIRKNTCLEAKRDGTCSNF